MLSSLCYCNIKGCSHFTGRFCTTVDTMPHLPTDLSVCFSKLILKKTSVTNLLSGLIAAGFVSKENQVQSDTPTYSCLLPLKTAMTFWGIFAYNCPVYYPLSCFSLFLFCNNYDCFLLSDFLFPFFKIVWYSVEKKSTPENKRLHCITLITFQFTFVIT